MRYSNVVSGELETEGDLIMGRRHANTGALAASQIVVFFFFLFFKLIGRGVLIEKEKPFVGVCLVISLFCVCFGGRGCTWCL